METVDERLKYRIKELLVRKHGSEDAIRRAKDDINEVYGIPLATINYDINVRMCTDSEVPESRLQKYAKALDVTTAQLKEDYVKYLQTKTA